MFLTLILCVSLIYVYTYFMLGLDFVLGTECVSPIAYVSVIQFVILYAVCGLLVGQAIATLISRSLLFTRNTGLLSIVVFMIRFL